MKEKFDDKVSDWNNDFVFNNEVGSNEKYVLTNDGTDSVFIGDITTSSGAFLGLHRIRMTYNDDPEPCGESSYGEIEDYNTLIIGGGCLEITWEPASFNQYVEIGQTAQVFLNIGNTGTSSLWTLYWWNYISLKKESILLI